MNIQEYKSKKIKEVKYFLRGLHPENIGVKDKNVIGYVTPECSDFFNRNELNRSITNKLIKSIQGCYNELISPDLEFISSDEQEAQKEIDTAIKNFVDKVRRAVNFYKHDIIKASFQSKEQPQEEGITVDDLPEVKEKNLIYTGLNFIKLQIGDNVYSVPKIGREAEHEDATIDGLYQMIIYVYALKLMIEDKKQKLEEFIDFIATNLSVKDEDYVYARQVQNKFLNEQNYESFIKKYNAAVEEVVTLIINREGQSKEQSVARK